MNLKKFAFSSLLALSAGTAGTVSAQENSLTSSGYAGLLFGYAKPENIDGRLGFGAEVGLRLENGPTVGAFLLTSNKNLLRIHHYGLAADFAMSGMMTGARIGALIGAQTSKVENTSISDTSIALGPRIGFDYVVAAPLSVGVDVAALWAFADETMMTFYGLGSIKYWF